MYSNENMNVEGRCGQEEDHLLFCEMLTRVCGGGGGGGWSDLVADAAAAKFSFTKRVVFQIILGVQPKSFVFLNSRISKSFRWSPTVARPGHSGAATQAYGETEVGFVLIGSYIKSIGGPKMAKKGSHKLMISDHESVLISEMDHTGHMSH